MKKKEEGNRGGEKNMEKENYRGGKKKNKYMK